MIVSKKERTKIKISHLLLVLVFFCIGLMVFVLQRQVGLDQVHIDQLPSLMASESRKGSEKQGLVIDIMSVGSKTRPQYQQAQMETFATHRSIRYFFNVTEVDDSDPTCAENFGPEDAFAVSKFCHKHKWERSQFLMRYLRTPYARERWLKGKPSPHGWMCAQVRPSHGLGKVVDRYRELQGTLGDKALPDYLFIMDDDTYVNFELFEQYMSTFDTSTPRAVAGCMVRSPIMEVNFTIPFGGFGMIFSKGAIRNYMRPVFCSGTDIDEFSESACRRVKENQIGEAHLFKEGMSVSDLQKAYASWQPYVQYKTWSTGFCLHSDWMWGFFSNFYNISKHNDGDEFAGVPHARMDGYNLSELYAGAQESHHKDLRRICNNEKRQCFADSHICHYQSPEDMKRLTKAVQQGFPARFKSLLS